MKIRKSLWTITLLLVGFSAGAYAGQWRATRKVEGEWRRRTNAFIAGHYAYLNYRLGDYANAKRSLLYHTSLLDAMGDDPLAGGKASALDAVTNYVRLAKLEERNGGTARDEYMREATARCERIKWRRGCSEDYLRGYVDKLDTFPQQAK